MAKISGKQSAYLSNEQNKSQRKSLYLVFFVIALAAICFLAYKLLFGVIPGIYLAGGLAAAGLLAGELLRESNAHGFRAGAFEKGRTGENDILKTFKKLPDNFSVFQGVRMPGAGDIDFVVVGNGGIFAVEVKSCQGLIEFNGRDLTRNKRPFEGRDYLSQTVREAWMLESRLRQMAGERIAVIPLLVFSGKHAKLHIPRASLNGVFVSDRNAINSLICSYRGDLPGDLLAKACQSLGSMT